MYTVNSYNEEFNPNGSSEQDPTGVADPEIRYEYYRTNPTHVVLLNQPGPSHPNTISIADLQEAQHELETQSTDDEDDDSEMPFDEDDGSDEE